MCISNELHYTTNNSIRDNYSGVEDAIAFLISLKGLFENKFGKPWIRNLIRCYKFSFGAILEVLVLLRKYVFKVSKLG